MTRHTSDRKLFCTVVIGAAFVMGSIAAGGQATAQVLMANVDMGGPGGGGGSATIDTDWAKTSNERSIELTESKEAPGGVLAGIPAPPSRVAYEESEHAVAQNRDSVASQAPQSDSPNQAAF
jgi:hypothetical protein